MSGDTEQDMIIFTAALRLPEEERAAFLVKACAGDEVLRRKVKALLAAHKRAGDFLEKPPATDETEQNGHGNPGAKNGD